MFTYGQRVKAISPPDGNKELVGKTGTIIRTSLDACGWVGVDFDERFDDGHVIIDDFCFFKAADSGWNCPPDSLKAIADCSPIGIEDFI